MQKSDLYTRHFTKRKILKETFPKAKFHLFHLQGLPVDSLWEGLHGPNELTIDTYKDWRDRLSRIRYNTVNVP